MCSGLSDRFFFFFLSVYLSSQTVAHRRRSIVTGDSARIHARNYIHHNSASCLVYIRMASILNTQSYDLIIIINWMKSLARLKDQIKSLVYKIKIDFHRLLDGNFIESRVFFLCLCGFNHWLHLMGI